jgi:hypothetical protein
MTDVSRRRALKTLGTMAAATSLPFGVVPCEASGGQAAFDPSSITADALTPIADVVLPSELGREGQARAVSAFIRWIRSYREGADMDHGYGSTRIRATGASPARGYPSQLAALDSAARRRGAAFFAKATPEVRRELVLSAIRDAHIDRLPRRPSGGHVAVDLMAHYFNSADAEDVCYRAAIGRDSCRGLPGSEKRPAPLK